jgi:8-oxo-dGTP diphosphatase
VLVGRFLCGIAAVIYHPATATYLLLRRAADRDAGGGEWESVTGRVDQGEGFEAALHREVREELGVEIQVDFIIGTSHFYRGAPVPENELLAVKYACTLVERAAIQVSTEHSEHRWLTADEVYTLLPPEHWLHQTIRRAELTRAALPASLLATHRREGFENT